MSTISFFDFIIVTFSSYFLMYLITQCLFNKKLKDNLVINIVAKLFCSAVPILLIFLLPDTQVILVFIAIAGVIQILSYLNNSIYKNIGTFENNQSIINDLIQLLEDSTCICEEHERIYRQEVENIREQLTTIKSVQMPTVGNMQMPTVGNMQMPTTENTQNIKQNEVVKKIEDQGYTLSPFLRSYMQQTDLRERSKKPTNYPLGKQ